MNHAGSLAWFARHELNLAWREWAALVSSGRKLKDGAILLGMLVVVFGLHSLAYAVLSPFFLSGAKLDTTALVMISTSILLTFTMMLSQALESVTRTFYSRADLDLILSSPASSQNLFAVRISTQAITTAVMSGLLVAPFINVAAMVDGPHWFAAYGVLLASAGTATGCAVLSTLGLFRWVGARRTRLVAQVVAAVVGASFIVGLQVVAIVSYGTMSRFNLLSSDSVIQGAPALDSLWWLPAAAVAGNSLALVNLVVLSGLFFALTTWAGARQFREMAVAASGVTEKNIVRRRARTTFRRSTPHATLMRKEWQLLCRDPWLVSQTLMQLFYLVPPAMMLWVYFGQDVESVVIISPVIVMAIGQLAGGLAWLAISGEDAPDLIATAPVKARAIVSAKILTVLAIIAAFAMPLLIAMSLMSAWGALVTLAGVLCASLSAVLIQFWFRAQAKRTHFRRRHTASRTSTISEALASILWAGAAAIAVLGSLGAIIMAVLATAVVVMAWAISPRAS